VGLADIFKKNTETKDFSSIQAPEPPEYKDFDPKDIPPPPGHEHAEAPQHQEPIAEPEPIDDEDPYPQDDINDDVPGFPVVVMVLDATIKDLKAKVHEAAKNITEEYGEDAVVDFYYSTSRRLQS